MAEMNASIPKLFPRKRASLGRKAPEAPDPSPPPPTPPLPAPPDLTNHTYIHPSRRILGTEDHDLFLKGETCTLVQAWIFGLSDAVRGVPIPKQKGGEDVEASKPIRLIVKILEEVETILKKYPREDTGSRFGNPVFRTFLDQVERAIPAWHQQLGLSDAAQIEEVATYLQHSFGNRSRIDYGSGHEVNFFLWLLCLNRIGFLADTGEQFKEIGLIVLPAYLCLMRHIQEEYYLEPAGSHGVWGLDDYQFLPFLLGASQLTSHPYITPKSIHNALILEEEGDKYLYLDQVRFVNSVKNVEGLRWHSPMLDDISGARNWAKIEGGMRKMFVREVLGKVPVMQHFLFGSLIPAVEGMSEDDDMGREEEEAKEGGEVKVFDDKDGKRHVHSVVGWGDCCGIRVPAAVGAEGEERKRGMGLRRVPFD